jgi:dGTPase
MNSEDDVVAWILDPLSPADRDGFQEFEQNDGKHNRPRHKSLDCSIMDAADDIAYGVHDLEDAIALNLITEAQFRQAILEDSCSSFLDALKAKYPAESANDVYGLMAEGLFGDSGSRKRFISRLVHHFVVAMEYVEHEQFAEPLIRYRARMKAHQRRFLVALQDLIARCVIKSPVVQHLEFKGQSMVVAVFEAMLSDPVRLLPADALACFKESSGDLRVVCDFVAGMTDSYLLRTYERLFAPRMGSVFDRL